MYLSDNGTSEKWEQRKYAVLPSYDLQITSGKRLTASVLAKFRFGNFIRRHAFALKQFGTEFLQCLPKKTGTALLWTSKPFDALHFG